MSLPPVVLGPIEVEEDPAEETPRPLPLPYRARPNPYAYEPSSRELMLGWCFWLLASWSLLGMGIDGTPIRWMIFASAMGMMLVWPVYRLSQSGFRNDEPPARESPVAPALVHDECNDPMDMADASAFAPSPIDTDPPLPSTKQRLIPHLTPGLIFRDWFALNGVFQAVIWPHLLTGQWTLEQAGWVSASVATWSLLVAAIVAWGCRFSSGLIRTTAMLLVLLLILGEPIVLATANALAERWQMEDLDWPMSVSPIEALYALTAPPTDYAPGRWIATVLCVLLVALVAWARLLGKARRRIE